MSDSTGWSGPQSGPAQPQPFGQPMGGFVPQGAGFPGQQAMPPGSAPPPPRPAAKVGNVVSFDDDVQLSELEPFPKLNVGQRQRFAFAAFKANGTTPEVMHQRMFYPDPVMTAAGERKFSFQAPDDPADKELLNQARAKFGDPKNRFHTIVVTYNCDVNGAVIWDRDPATNKIVGLKYWLRSLAFSEKDWETYKGLHTAWGLSKHDLFLRCTEQTARGSKHEIEIQPDCVLTQNAKLMEKVRADALDLFRNNLQSRMGRVRTAPEIRYILAGLAPPRAGDGQPQGQAQGQFPGAMSGPQFPSYQNPQLGAPPQGLSAPPGAGAVGTGAPVAEDWSSLVAQTTQSTPVPGAGSAPPAPSPAPAAPPAPDDGPLDQDDSID